MSTKTTFKRIALVAVAALGLGVLSVAPSSAALIGETLTISSATASTTVSDSATATLTHVFGVTATDESSTITSTCISPAGASCPTAVFWQTDTSDTANVGVMTVTRPVYTNTSWTDTATSTSGTARSVVNVKAVNFTAAGTYTYTFYTKAMTVQNSGVATVSTASTTWTVTVAASTSTTATGISALYVSKDIQTAEMNRSLFKPASDSAVVVDRGTAASPSAVAYALISVKNTAGDTRTATATATKNTGSGTAVSDTITATVAGPGMVTGISSTKAKTATFQTNNNATFGTSVVESLTVWSDGTAGVSTITLSGSSGAVFGSFTVTFTGVPASATSPSFSDTIVAMGQDSPTITAVIKDSAGTALTSGTVYVYSSDTAVAGNTPVSYPNIGRTGHAVTVASGRATVQVAITDTGSATLYFRDSWTVAASTWVSSGITLTVTGNVVKSLTVTFDKSTYSPGERAIITYTAKGSAGEALATRAASFSSTTNTVTFGEVTGGASPGGTNAGYSSTTASILGYKDSGVETRVVTMPSFATDVTYVVKYATFGDTVGDITSVTATAKVVDAQAAANAAAAAAATAAAKDASDAATDAALEATDAAYAATDAANIAAEAADAATAAAEAATDAANAAKDSADAATAAVEELATSVAKLMAALQAQITTLAKVVAKIAVKVKA